MKTNKTYTSETDRFSWGRIWRFGLIYQHSLKRQLIVYGIISVISAIITLLPLSSGIQMAFFSLFGSILGFLYYLSPLVLSKWGDTRMIMDMTPALPIEKFLFFMFYFLILLPLVVFGPTLLSQYLYFYIPSIQTEPLLGLLHLSFDYDYNTIAKYTQGCGFTLTCFYVILSCRGNRTLKGILAVFGMMAALGILGGIFGFTMALNDDFYYTYAMESNSEDPYATSVGMDHILTDLRIPLICLNVCFFIYNIFLLWASYRRLSHPKI